MTPPITTFRGDYFFLSNFYPSPIFHMGITFPTVEHAYQAAKSSDPAEVWAIAHAATPGEAKRLGRRIKHVDPHWATTKYDVMRLLLQRKFANPELAALLRATGGSQIEEHNYWGDTDWGIYNGIGQNNLGKLLMRIRATIE